MRSIAAWLVARPHNGVLALAATLLLPFAQIVSGAVVGLLAFKHGAALAALQAGIAAAALSLISLVVSAPVSQLLGNAVVTWLPILVLAAAVRGWRSLTLALQMTAILALLVTLGFYAVLGDPTGYWTEMLVRISESFRGMGLERHADVLYEQREILAPQMTVLVVLTIWSLYATVLLLGYAFYRTLPEVSDAFGLFRNLNLGRVLALTMAVASVVALLTGSVWLQNFAFVAFAVFWLQGLAIVHWLHAGGRLPLFLVLVVYALLPLLNALMVMALAVVGYIDAWFDFRARKATQ